MPAVSRCIALAVSLLAPALGAADPLTVPTPAAPATAAPAATTPATAAPATAAPTAPATKTVTATPGFEYPEPPPLESAEQLNAVIEALRRANWQVYADVARSDPAYRAQIQDLEKLLLPPQHEERLKALSEAAGTEIGKGDARTLRATLSEAQTLVGQEAYRWTLVEWLLRFEDSFTAHEESVQRLENALAPELRAAPHTRIAVARTSLNADFAGAMTADSAAARTAAVEQLTRSYMGVVAVYNHERGNLAEALDNQQRAQGNEPEAQVRETPCPAAVTQGSGSEQPTFAPGNATPEAFYPDASRRALFEGTVTVQAWVSATGCMQRAAVYVSSGVPELDEAAIAWTQQARFYPAERAHQRVDATLRFRVKFALHN